MQGKTFRKIILISAFTLGTVGCNVNKSDAPIKANIFSAFFKDEVKARADSTKTHIDSAFAYAKKGNFASARKELSVVIGRWPQLESDINGLALQDGMTPARLDSIEDGQTVIHVFGKLLPFFRDNIEAFSDSTKSLGEALSFSAKIELIGFAPELMELMEISKKYDLQVIPGKNGTKSKGLFGK